MVAPSSPLGGGADLLGKGRELQLALPLKCPFVSSSVMSSLSLTQYTHEMDACLRHWLPLCPGTVRLVLESAEGHLHSVLPNN